MIVAVPCGELDGQGCIDQSYICCCYVVLAVVVEVVGFVLLLVLLLKRLYLHCGLVHRRARVGY